MLLINWNRFVQTREGALVRKFFIKLTMDITHNEEDNVNRDEVGSAQSKKEKVLLLNTKKGYWLYKIFEREEGRASKLPSVHAVSDRFAKKQVDGAFWCDKIVYLVDDTLTRGYSLMETYELLSKWVKKEDIHPIVFALNEEVNIEEKIAQASDETRSFWQKLRYYIRMSQDDMGHFCIYETKMMHAENIPYVIDLPYLKDEQQSQKMNFEVTLTQEQFTVLQQKNEFWKFHFNHYKLKYDVEGEVLQGFIIETRDEQLLAGTEKFISDYVITGTYSVDEEQKVHLVFVPFAIANSLSMDAVEALWNELMGEEYISRVEFLWDSRRGKPTEDNDENVNLWRRRYRECVYVMSMEIAERFKEYLETLTEIKLCYDYNIVKEHFSQEFVEKAKEIEKERVADSGRICNAVRRLKSIFYKDYVLEESVAEDDSMEENVEDLEEAAYDLVLSEVENRKKIFLKNPAAGKKVAVLEYGEICAMLDTRLSFRTKGERRYVFTRIIVTLLQTSTCSGRLFVDFVNGMIEKGIRYGENSDLLLPFLDLNFYWAVVLLVEKEGKKAVLESYDRLIRRLEGKYRELGLYGTKAAEKQFFRNEQYFKMVLENDFQLYNKYFYFEPYFRGMRSTTEMYYMKKIEEFVANV